MEAHPNHSISGRKEIRCRDCGHAYSIAVGQRSSRCTVCGNIEFHGDSAAASGAPANKTKSSPAPHIERAPSFEEVALAPAEDPLAAFRTVPDGHEVQDILAAYQVEWQLWAKLVQNFSNPAYHAAYLSHVAGSQEIAQGTARYQEHRAVMTLSTATHWEAEVAEFMLGRLEMLATLRMEQEGSAGFRVWRWFWLLPVQSRPFRIFWIATGMIGMWKLFSSF